MAIYTSYYAGKQIGQSISISRGTPQGVEFEKLPLFMPSEQLLKDWRASDKGESAQQEYTERFNKEMAANDAFIDVWINRLSGDVTLNCYEKTGQFCHRHLVGEIIKTKRPDLWGGEASEVSQSPIPNPQSLTPDPSLFDWLENTHGIKLYEPIAPTPKPWSANVGNYALYNGEVVKIVGGSKGGTWQIERSPHVNPEQILSNECIKTTDKKGNPREPYLAKSDTFLIKTKDLTQPPAGHPTWTDADFRKPQRMAA